MAALREIGPALAMAALLVHAVDARAADVVMQATVSPAHRLLDVPYLPQTAELCGGAAVAMVMRYWGDRAVLPVDFRALVSSPAGIVTTDLARAVSDRGWQVLAREAEADAPLADLQRDVDQGRPVIALIEDSPGTLHYVVVVGLTSDDRIVIHDPARTSFRVLAFHDFDAQWRATRRWRMLVLPSATRPPSAPATPPAQPAATGAARTGACGAMVDQAVAQADTDAAAADRALRAAADLCPGEGDPWLELAGLRFRAKAWRESGDLAVQALSADPANPDAWSLLATSRFLDDDLPSALAAWNHVGEPAIDDITLTGALRTPQPALVRLTGLEPRTLLTRSSFTRAARRLADAPTADATRLTFTPTADGRASVAGSMVEKSVLPHQPMALVAIGVRAFVTDDLRVMTANLFSQGETLTMDWRYPPSRPRYGAILALPAPTPLSGVVTIDGFWERQSYAVPLADGARETTIDPRRRVTFDLGTWWTANTKVDLGAGLDRFGDADYGSFHASIEQHLFDDHITGRVDAEVWRFGGARFSTRTALVAWTSTTDVKRSGFSVLAGVTSASADSPRALWMGAGTNNIRPVLLRAHPLAVDNVITTTVLGRQLAFGTAEFTRPLTTRFFGSIAAAAFVDTAQARHTLEGNTSPLEVDMGIGLRLRVQQAGALVRMDIARGLRDGGTVLSAGWTTSISRLFSRGMPW